ncbi:MAG: tetratricopeptide repeat protein [Parvibaculaceae bacterium]
MPGTMPGMKRYGLPLLAAALLFAGAVGPAASQGVSEEQAAAPQQQPAPDAAELLDRLFGQLHATDNDRSAKTIEQAIWRIWSHSGSPTCDALVGQADKAIEARELDIAIRMLDTAVELKPDFAEALNRRATAYFLNRQFDRSLADIDKVLALEPRHFGALSGLGAIRREQGDKREALKAYRRALAVNPFLASAKAAVKELQGEVEQDI